MNEEIDGDHLKKSVTVNFYVKDSKSQKNILVKSKTNHVNTTKRVDI